MKGFIELTTEDAKILLNVNGIREILNEKTHTGSNTFIYLNDGFRWTVNESYEQIKSMLEQAMA